MSDAPDAPTDAPDTPTGDPDGGPTFPKWLKWGLLGALAVLIVGYGAIFLYAKVLNDSPDELDEGDLSAALAVDDTTPDEPAEEPAVETDEPAETATTEPPADDADPSSGEWLITDASEFGYRVNEVLFGVDTAAACLLPNRNIQ